MTTATATATATRRGRVELYRMYRTEGLGIDRICRLMGVNQRSAYRYEAEHKQLPPLQPLPPPLRAPNAVCAGKDINLWYSDDPQETEYAKHHCRACPHHTECALHALAHEERGVWGATTDSERERFRDLIANLPGAGA